MPEPDRDLPDAGASACSESDLAQLAARFAAHGGGNLPAELSADLALEIVLNEIVEQACVATGATGAAVILRRAGEMVCRASGGANAPELGARLSGDSGLTAECLKTGQTQRCEDALVDQRADVEACRSLGVRSVIALPLAENGHLAGVLEAFSPRPGAFGVREELSLQVLAGRINRNLETAKEQSLAKNLNAVEARMAPRISEITVNEIETPNLLGKDLREERLMASSLLETENEERSGPGESPKTALDRLIRALGLVVVACALWLGIQLGGHLGWFKTWRGRRPVQASQVDARNDVAAAGQGSTAQVGKNETAGSPPTSAPVHHDPGVASLPAGTVLLYENGREVLRMTPAGGERKKGATVGAQETSAGQSAQPLEVPPEQTMGSVLYRVEPYYPEQALQQKIEGAVVLEVHTSLDAKVEEIKVLSGPPILAEAAIAAVKQWQFRPRKVNGQPVETQRTVTLNFRLPH